MYLVFYYVNLYSLFVYLWLVPHPAVFMTHLWIHKMYVYVCVCMYICNVCMYLCVYVSVYVCIYMCVYVCVCVYTYIGRGADKSLARPEREQTTATKLGIYSTYSLRISMNFPARCSNFCKPLKKNQNLVRPTRSPRKQWSPRRTKNGELSIFFQSREQAVVRRGQIRRIGWVIKRLEAHVNQFLLGCECRVSRGIACKN
jgi:hypothetical protein